MYPFSKWGKPWKFCMAAINEGSSGDIAASFLSHLTIDRRPVVSQMLRTCYSQPRIDCKMIAHIQKTTVSFYPLLYLPSDITLSRPTGAASHCHQARPHCHQARPLHRTLATPSSPPQPDTTSIIIPHPSVPPPTPT